MRLLIFISILLSVMYATNPTTSNFSSFVADHISEKAREEESHPSSTLELEAWRTKEERALARDRQRRLSAVRAAQEGDSWEKIPNQQHKRLSHSTRLSLKNSLSTKSFSPFKLSTS